MKSRKTLLVLASLGLSISFVSCSSDNNEPEVKPLPDPVVTQPVYGVMKLTDAEKKIVDKQNDLTLKMLSSITDNENGTYAFSPASMYPCFAMAANGGNDYVRKTLADALGDGTMEGMNRFNYRLMSEFPYSQKDVTLRLANALFLNSEHAFNTSFTDVMNDYYHSLPGYFSDAENLKAWMRDVTEGMITELPPRIEATEVAVINTLYMKGAWSQAFPEEGTVKETFKGETGKGSMVDMMHLTANLNLKVGNGYDAVSLPIGEDEGYEMVIIRPEDGETLKALTSSVISDALSGNAWQDKSVNMSLPKFKIDSETGNILTKGTPLHDALYSANSGFPNILDDATRVLGMSLWGKVSVAVGEEGFQGAGVTVLFTETSPGQGEAVEAKPYDFTCNRPFLYVVRERNTGIITFAGYVKTL